MGFYGNITNTNRTQFTFDRIYANRRSMDDAASSDGVFVGRYVLVDYDSDPIEDIRKLIEEAPVVFLKEDEEGNLSFYTDMNFEEKNQIKVDVNLSKNEGNYITKGTILKVPGAKKDENNNTIVYNTLKVIHI